MLTAVSHLTTYKCYTFTFPSLLTCRNASKQCASVEVVPYCSIAVTGQNFRVFKCQATWKLIVIGYHHTYVRPKLKFIRHFVRRLLKTYFNWACHWKVCAFIVFISAVHQFSEEFCDQGSHSTGNLPSKHDLILSLAVGGRWITAQYDLQVRYTVVEICRVLSTILSQS